ncbi:hypothetical protein [Streptomyces capillispiralis]|uniref:Uncharacterized protein n=1 Tax=Streptomyces capillispiralis TaxID=68182 RepID=A0A561TS45_9ACTN|nr:hypothetical protein [Streptomyces capillispiralis]TWF89922.1 hypothetical protein FHX78_116971 [Streptomyces capillispiralis]
MLDQSTLTGRAAREAAEELEVGAADEDLMLWGLTHGENGSVGLTYLAPTLSERHRARTSPLSRRPSASRAVNVNSWRAHRTSRPDWPARTDYLKPIVRRIIKCR